MNSIQDADNGSEKPALKRYEYWSEILCQVPKFKAEMLDHSFHVSYDLSKSKSYPDVFMDSMARDLRDKIRKENPELLEKEVAITFDDHFAENGQLIRTVTIAEEKQIRQP
ncbi:hypothetical protein LZD49_12505 [Dyadobacter sp. CY261]|uniref:hypothetical protein n=1 Tax=Dyadobacter sp. CY261 TaxID=2907203 RepID=UPI001F2727E8|nr:hypothetical protein [Dyadobacter sp. CY261]MCF0071294.1 hypothetical protein [Dyadobacter sp. CY261]